VIARSPSLWSAELGQEISSALLEHAPVGVGAESHLRSAIISVATRPGKLARARLVLGTTLAHGIDRDTGLSVATAIEYFHLSSLLLDDLPCMDDAAMRRGQACVHRTHGEATAILSALAFINRAYALVGFAFATQPGDVRLKAHACLDASLGWAGLIGGQARDLRFATSDRSVREASGIALGKTGTVFSLGLLLPALLARPDAGERRALERLCIYWSLAYQALDDLQDILATSVEAGKTTGRDAALVRPNIARSLGLSRTRDRIARLLGQSGRQIERLIGARPAWAYLEDFQRYLAEANVPALARDSASAA
jgi:geranylgeranyl diphosphate synthase type II